MVPDFFASRFQFWHQQAAIRTLVLCLLGVTDATRKASTVFTIIFGVVALLTLNEQSHGTGLKDTELVTGIILLPAIILFFYGCSFACGWLIALTTVPFNFLLLWLAREDIACMDDAALTQFGNWHGIRVYGAFIITTFVPYFLTRDSDFQVLLLLLGVTTALFIPIALKTGQFTARGMKKILEETAYDGKNGTAL